MPDIFKISSPDSPEVPILLSVPHCAVAFPEELSGQFNPVLTKSPDDTDWFVDKLYSFAIELGIPMISATYNRWVIDLNRDPESKPLYQDGRIITALCPTTTFLGEPIYVDQRKDVDKDEVQRRLKNYYDPYHQKIKELLNNLHSKFGRVLLWDCHSIRQHVSTIHSGTFPDFVLGDADGTTASPGLIESALGTLDHSRYKVSHNHPFKGGYITRHFGKPAENQHAIQLEMTKVNYMDDSETLYDEKRATEVQGLLRSVFLKLIDQL